MTAREIDLRPFDPHRASDAEFAARNDFQNRLRAEAWPEDPPVPLAVAVRNLRHSPPFIRNHRWLAWAGDEVVGGAELTVWYTEDNRHSCWFGVGVLPERRRQGIGTRLLAEVVPAARAAERRLMMAGTDGDLPAGEPFMEALGARRGLAERVSQLELAGVDRDRLRAWQEGAAERAAGFTLECWEGPYPEASLPEVAAMKQAMNHAPREDLEMEDEVITPEQLRQRDASMVAREVQRWTIVARAPRVPSGQGAIAGYTEVYWGPENPTLVHQGDTAVFPQYRNRGLGRWLKAAMLEKVLRERPQARRVRTDNACSNAPMLNINVAMGFQPRKAWTVWQVDTGRAAEYVAGRGS